MNKAIVAAATFVALGTGVLGVRAFDLKGSDTMKKLTTQVIAACPGATGAINYVGGGSDAGENAMVSGTQAIAPMSRFMAGTGTTGVCAVDTTRAEAIEIAGDAVVMSMNATHHAACDPNQGSAADNACQGYIGGGLNHSRTLSTGVTLHSWKDTVRLIYFGLAPNDFPLASGTGPGDQVLAVNIARRDCEDPSRVELVDNFGKLFDIDCGNDGGCTRLQHAFRHDETSVATDVLREMLDIESPGQFGNKGFPFCNEYVPAVTLNTTNRGNNTTCTTDAQCTTPGYTVCTDGTTCHRPNNGCTVATSATDCPTGFSCDPGQLQCAQTCAIGSDASCAALLPGATCHAAGVCKPGTCFTDTDCSGAGLCDTSTNLCRMPPSRVSCTASGQCPGIGATCTLPTDMNATTGWCVNLVDAPQTDTKVDPRCGVPGWVGGTQPGTVATVPGELRSISWGVGFENQQNNDPIRRQAIGLNRSAGGGATIRLDANPAEQVATHCGDNGLVLPISIPWGYVYSGGVGSYIDAFANTVCGLGKVAFFPAVQIVGGTNARYQLCPNGDMPLGSTGWDPVIRGAIRGTGTCYAMTTFSDATNAACINFATNRPQAAFALPPSTYVTLHAGDPTSVINPATFDARVYNNTLWFPASQSRVSLNYTFNGQEQPPTPSSPNGTTSFNQSVTAAFYRIHQTRTAKGYNHTAACNSNADCPAATPTCDTGTHTCFTNAQAGCSPGACCENYDPAIQIGCLTTASPCSLGYSRPESLSCKNNAEQLTTQPVAGGAQVVETNFSIGLEHAAVNGLIKEVSSCGSNACISADNLTINPPALQYPLTWSMYLSSIAGFESPALKSGELALSQCLVGAKALSSGRVDDLFAADGFEFADPPYGSHNSVRLCCRDFAESACSATSASTNNACANNDLVKMPTYACDF